MIPFKHECDEGNVPTWILNPQSGRVRFTYLACKICGGSSMGNGLQAGEVEIAEAEYNRIRTQSIQQAA